VNKNMEKRVSLPAGKLAALRKQLLQLTRIAVAYSGGVDSTFLLFMAVETLGVENVVALQLHSRLQSRSGLVDSERVILDDFPGDIQFQRIEVTPLQWDRFVVNDKKRCYYCKKEMYTTLLTKARSMGFAKLADGTNVDDLQEDRPGLRALEELGVFTPLESAGFTKKEIRRAAEQLGLSNFDLPSNSCLATRIVRNTTITEADLQRVEEGEKVLQMLGFTGCRLRIGSEYTVIEIAEDDFQKFLVDGIRQKIDVRFRQIGIKSPFLSLKGR